MSNRAAKLTRTHKVLKKHYKPYATADRPVLEQLLYASCLQGATYDLADEAFAKLQQCYYDWNEVRVTTVSELSEVMANLPQPSASASQLKRTLQSVFESYYSFDLEALKKESIGKAVKQLKKLDGVSDFAVAFVTQSGFNGHSIPVTPESIEALRVLRVISDDEAREGPSSRPGTCNSEEQGGRVRIPSSPARSRLRRGAVLAARAGRHAGDRPRGQGPVSQTNDQEERHGQAIGQPGGCRT